MVVGQVQMRDLRSAAGHGAVVGEGGWAAMRACLAPHCGLADERLESRRSASRIAAFRMADWRDAAACQEIPPFTPRRASPKPLR